MIFLNSLKIIKMPPNIQLHKFTTKSKILQKILNIFLVMENFNKKIILKKKKTFRKKSSNNIFFCKKHLN